MPSSTIKCAEQLTFTWEENKPPSLNASYKFFRTDHISKWKSKMIMKILEKHIESVFMVLSNGQVVKPLFLSYC
jgi:hypothetical protein